MLSIARQMLEYKEREDGARYALELLLQLVAHRNDFLTMHNVRIWKRCAIHRMIYDVSMKKFIIVNNLHHIYRNLLWSVSNHLTAWQQVSRWK